MGYFVKNRRLQSGSSGVVLPTGSASQRPLAPVFGMIRYNTDVPGIEYFNGSSWLYLADNSGSNFVVQTFTGDGSTSTFTLNYPISSATDIMVFVGSVYQVPTTLSPAYTVTSLYNLNFSSAPPDSMIINVIFSQVP